MMSRWLASSGIAVCCGLNWQQEARRMDECYWVNIICWLARLVITASSSLELNLVAGDEVMRFKCC